MAAILGALIISGGALFGIWLGAVYAAGRLSAQLDEQRQWFSERREEDSKRLDRQLEANSERLSLQLSSDRRVRDVEDIRRLLDEVLAELGAARSATNRALVQISNHALLDKLMPEDDGGLSESVHRKAKGAILRKAWEAIDPLEGSTQRLTLRFGAGHDIVVNYLRLRSELTRVAEVMSAFGYPTEGEDYGRAVEAWDNAENAYLCFMDAAREYVRVIVGDAA